MKRIINNKKYDTETARFVGSWDNGLMCSDFDYIEERLYRKKTGEYFLNGEGGARTKYAETREGGSFVGGEAIIPLSFENASAWAEKNLSADDYEAEFGEVSEDAEDVVVSCRVSAAAKRALEKYATLHGLSQSKALEEILFAL